MTPKDKAIRLVDFYRIILINEDTECGEEILCTVIAKKSALIAVDEILNLDLHDVGDYKCFDTPSEWYISYWEEVKHEIEKL
jgi:hypothetical protein